MRVVAAAVLMIAALVVAPDAALSQAGPPVRVITVTVPSQTVTNQTVMNQGGTVGRTITPLGIYAVGSVFCAAASPIIGTIVLGREMTTSEVWRSTFGCFLGPPGWLLADLLVPPDVVPPTPPPPGPRIVQRRPSPRRNVSMPPPGETNFVPDEVLLEVRGRSSSPALGRLAQRLHLTRLETQSFSLTGRTLQRWRIGPNTTVRATLRRLAGYGMVAAAQPNWLYSLQQAPSPAPAQADSAQYVVNKLHLIAAHRISNGNNVRVAVIDSQIDIKHPDIAGDIVAKYDALGGKTTPHPHGTGMAGAIAAHHKLIGIAPHVQLLAVRAFAGEGESAQGTTFNVMKGLDWAARQNARIVNMSFAGPADRMFADMLAKAHTRGLVLIAAVGNAGPRSPPLYPAAYPEVIGVTATDAGDTLLPQANRGRQVAVSAPGVDILAPAPNDSYQLTTGTSVAAAHVSGVAALVLARNPTLGPYGVRQILERSARHIAGNRRDVGAGEVDALAAVEALAKEQARRSEK
jgi:subtilisin family serine protease